MYTQRLSKEEEEQVDYNQYSFTQSGVGNVTDAYLVKEQHRKRKEAEAKYLQSEANEKLQRETSEQLRIAIEEGKRTCPHCSDYHILEEFKEHLPFSMKALLLQDYGNNPSLHDHIFKYHPKIIEKLKQRADTKQQYLKNLSTQQFFMYRIKYAGTTAEDLQMLTRDLGTNPQFEVNRLTKEIRAAERKYPDLVKIKKEYLEELEKKPFGWC